MNIVSLLASAFGFGVPNYKPRVKKQDARAGSAFVMSREIAAANALPRTKSRSGVIAVNKRSGSIIDVECLTEAQKTNGRWKVVPPAVKSRILAATNAGRTAWCKGKGLWAPSH